MEILENIALFQRISSAIKADIETGDKYKALSKMEILEGELAIFRNQFESSVNTETKAEENEPVFTPPVDIVDTEIVE